MSKRFFSEPITRCKMRRTWGGTVVTVLTLLLLAALCGWLWSCVRLATVTLPGPGWSRSLAMAPVPQGMVFGLLLSFSAMAIVLAVRKVRANELEAELRWETTRNDDPFSVVTNDELRCVRIGLEDLRGIVHACRAESRVALLFVEAAMTTTDLDDYADALRAAHEKLAQVTRTLGELHKSLSHAPPEGGITTPEWPCAAKREDVS